MVRWGLMFPIRGKSLIFWWFINPCSFFRITSKVVCELRFNWHFINVLQVLPHRRCEGRVAYNSSWRPEFSLDLVDDLRITGRETTRIWWTLVHQLVAVVLVEVSFRETTSWTAIFNHLLPYYLKIALVTLKNYFKSVTAHLLVRSKTVHISFIYE